MNPAKISFMSTPLSFDMKNEMRQSSLKAKSASKIRTNLRSYLIITIVQSATANGIKWRGQD